MSSITTPQKPSSSSPSSPTLQHTPTGSPYISLPTSSNTPIYLTPYHNTDAQAIYETHNREEVSSVLIMPPHPYHLSDAEFWINLMLSPESPNLTLQAIRAGFPDERGTFIGSAALSRDEFEGRKEYEVGYYLHPDWRGMGIIGAAVKALMGWAREVYEAEVVVRVEEGNAKSRKVVEGVREWSRVPERDAWREWPERMGGGQRRVLFWRWEE